MNLADLEKLNAERWLAQSALLNAMNTVTDSDIIDQRQHKRDDAQWRLEKALANAADDLLAAAKERDALREALERIANFAPGYGDVAEQIAQWARHALYPELKEMYDEEQALRTQEPSNG